MEIGVKAIPYNRAMRKARERRGLTQRQLGRLIEVSQSTISSIERLCTPVDEDLANDIALVLGYEIDYLFPPETRDFKSQRNRSVEFVANVVSLDSLPSGEYLLPSLEKLFIREELVATVQKVLDTLPSEEKRVVSLRFGLEGGEPRTLEETGCVLGVTRERIRQIEQKGIKRLRHPVRSKLLRDYLDE